MFIIKRDGSRQKFNVEKIERAIVLAFHSQNQDTKPASQLALDVGESCSTYCNVNKTSEISIEQVQSFVEDHLIQAGHCAVSKAYILYRDQRAKLRNQRLKPDNMILADYIHRAKYARVIDGHRESYTETCNRVINMHRDKFLTHENGTEIYRTLNDIQDFMLAKRILPSMRSMQFGGEGILKNHARMYNCSFTHINRPEVFGQIFYLLLCGCGVGFSVQWQHVNQLPMVLYINKKRVHHHVIEDTIEGWGDAITALCSSYFSLASDIKGGTSVEFSYHKIRPEGSPLKTTGGLAPGHIPLKVCLEKVREIFHRAQGRQLRPIECHDIICHIADAVLAGGIRRSSLISLFSVNDTEMLYCKTPGVFDYNGTNSQRQMANNSAVILRSDVDRSSFDRLMQLTRSYGEPGFYFTDDLDYGTNPCGEIGLNPVLEYEVLPPSDKRMCTEVKKYVGFSFCNLTEINGALIKTPEDFIECAKVAAALGTLQASYTDFPYLGGPNNITERIVRREALLGVGITGMMDSPDVCFNAEVQRAAALAAVEENKRVAALLGIRPAARVTTVKPSGTTSLELGCIGSGIHPQHARRYFRRVTANPNEPVAKFFKQYNPHMVEVKPNGDWSICFPIEVSAEATTIKSIDEFEFIERVFSTYENWIKPGTADQQSSPGLTHNVSNTVAYKEENLEKVIDLIWQNRGRITAMSFVPLMLDKGIPFIPREEVVTAADEAKWNMLIENFKPVPWDTLEETGTGENRVLDAACAGGKCEI